MIARHVEKLLPHYVAAYLPEEPHERPASTASSAPIADIAAGKAVVVVDDEDRENEGDLIFAAVQVDARADGLHHPPQQRRHLRADAAATCSTGSRSR